MFFDRQRYKTENHMIEDLGRNETPSDPLYFSGKYPRDQMSESTPGRLLVVVDSLYTRLHGEQLYSGSEGQKGTSRLRSVTGARTGVCNTLHL